MTLPWKPTFDNPERYSKTPRGFTGNKEGAEWGTRSSRRLTRRGMLATTPGASPPLAAVGRAPPHCRNGRPDSCRSLRWPGRSPQFRFFAWRLQQSLPSRGTQICFWARPFVPGAGRVSQGAACAVFSWCRARKTAGTMPSASRSESFGAEEAYRVGGRGGREDAEGVGHHGDRARLPDCARGDRDSGKELVSLSRRVINDELDLLACRREEVESTAGRQ